MKLRYREKARILIGLARAGQTLRAPENKEAQPNRAALGSTEGGGWKLRAGWYPGQMLRRNINFYKFNPDWCLMMRSNNIQES